MVYRYRTTSVTLTREMKADIEFYAAKKDLKLSQAMRELIQVGLDRSKLFPPTTPGRSDADAG